MFLSLVSPGCALCPSPLPAGFALPGFTFAEAEGGGQGAGFAEVVPWMQSRRRADVFAPPE